jgi:hypothetical protein
MRLGPEGVAPSEERSTNRPELGRAHEESRRGCTRPRQNGNHRAYAVAIVEPLGFSDWQSLSPPRARRGRPGRIPCSRPFPDRPDSLSKDHCEETNDDDPGNELSRQQDCLDRNDRGEDDQCRCDNGPPRHGTPVGGRNGRWFLEQFTTRSEQTADVERCGFRAPGTATAPTRPRNRLIGNRARRSSRSADLFSQFVEEGKRLLGSLRVGAGDAEDAVAAHPARVWSESAARRGRDLPSGARRTTGGELGRGPLD